MVKGNFFFIIKTTFLVDLINKYINYWLDNEKDVNQSV